MQKYILTLFLVNLFILVSCSQVRQEPNKAKLDILFNSISKHDMAFGTIAITQDNNLIYNKGIGYKKLASNENEPSELNTKYRIGSVTKMFTSVIILQLIEEDKLSLTETIESYFPNIPNANKISIQKLLSHSSGLSNYTEVDDFTEWKYTLKSKKELLEVITNLKAKFSPGEQNEYSNTNFLLLSYIIENVCHKSYQEVLNEKIIGKVNLENTYFENISKTELRNSKSYKYSNGEWKQQLDDIAENYMGAGSLVSTPKDLTKFINAVFTNKLLSSRSLKMMTTMNQDYGLGIFKFTFNSNIAFGHEGRINEYYTSLLYFPENKVALAYCTNGILYPRDDIIKKTVQILYNEPNSIPNFDSLEIDEEKVEKIIGNYSSNFMPIKVICKNKNNNLIVETQGTNFIAKPIDENYFMNLNSGYFFEFIPLKEELLIKETDNIYLLKKE